MGTKTTQEAQNDGGNKPPGINGGMPADSFKVMTGKSATTLESDGSEGSYNPIEKVDIITASILHQHGSQHTQH